MKKILSILLSLAFVGTLYAQNHAVAKKSIIAKKNNYDLSIYYPHFAGPFADTLNANVYAMFASVNPVKKHVEVVGDSSFRFMFMQIAQFLSDRGMQRSIDPLPYTHISGWNTFENKYVFSLILDQYFDMGAAHPTIIAQSVNVNHATDRIFDIKELVRDTTTLLQAAADVFCRERRLPKGALRILTGLNCELADLPMPKVCGFSHKGFVLFYNRGVIAPFGMPAIKIIVPYSMFKSILPTDFFDDAKTYTDGMSSGAHKVHVLMKSGKPRSTR